MNDNRKAASCLVLVLLANVAFVGDVVCAFSLEESTTSKCQLSFVDAEYAGLMLRYVAKGYLKCDCAYRGGLGDIDPPKHDWDVKSPKYTRGYFVLTFREEWKRCRLILRFAEKDGDRSDFSVAIDEKRSVGFFIESANWDHAEVDWRTIKNGGEKPLSDLLAECQENSKKVLAEMRREKEFLKRLELEP